jgi:hypothetical protein
MYIAIHKEKDQQGDLLAGYPKVIDAFGRMSCRFIFPNDVLVVQRLSIS